MSNGLDDFRHACGLTGPLRIAVRGPGGSSEPQEIATPFVVLGRQAPTDLLLADPAVSRRHAYLQVIDSRVFYFDLFSRTGVQVDGRPSPSGWLEPGKGLTVGPFTVDILEVPGTSAAVPAADPLASRPADRDPLPTVRLELTRAGQETVVWRMSRKLALVGQAAGCKVRLAVPGVSAVHCALVRTAAGLWVVDLHSTQGTQHNGQAVRFALVSDGDELGFGDMRARVRVGPPGGDAGPPSAVISGTSATRLAELEAALAAAQGAQKDQARVAAEAAEAWAAERAKLARECESAAADRDRAAADGQRLGQELDAARAELNARQTDLAAAADRERDLTAVWQQTEQDLQDVRNQLERQAAELSDVRARLEAARGASVVRERQLEEALAAARREADATGAALRAELEAARAEAQVLRQAARAAADRHAAELNTVHGRANGDREAERARADTHRQERDALQAELDAARTTAATTAAHSADLVRAAQAVADNLRAELAAARAGADERSRAAGAETDTLRAELGAAHREAEGLRQARAEADRVRGECDRVAARLAAAEAQLAAERESAKARDREHQTEMAAVRAAADQDRQALTAERDAARREADARGRQWETGLGAIRADAEEQMAALRAEADVLRRERDELAAPIAADAVPAGSSHQADRYAELVARIDALRAEFDQQVRAIPESRGGFLGRRRGASRPEDDGDRALDRRLTALQIEAAVEQERAAAAAARAELEGELAEARSRLAALANHEAFHSEGDRGPSPAEPEPHGFPWGM